MHAYQLVILNMMKNEFSVTVEVGYLHYYSLRDDQVFLSYQRLQGSLDFQRNTDMLF